jgi:hypothetical protein
MLPPRARPPSSRGQGTMSFSSLMTYCEPVSFNGEQGDVRGREKAARGKGEVGRRRALVCETNLLEVCNEDTDVLWKALKVCVPYPDGITHHVATHRCSFPRDVIVVVVLDKLFKQLP